MLSNDITKKIEDFVYKKPRSIQEIAEHINKNWRTADRYVTEIEKEYGTLTTRVFREGTRGALKIVYWASVEKVSNSIFQEVLEKEILSVKRKEDFRPFDIFQFVKDTNKKSRFKFEKEDSEGELETLKNIIESAEKQLLIFSGNLSFINFKNKKIDTFKIIENAAKRKISMKVVCRVDILGRKNIERMLSLNMKYGKELVEIHHREQPLRAIIVDTKFFDMKEKEEQSKRQQEFSDQLFMFYMIKDKEWVEWLTRIFWKMYSSSIDVNKRLEELNKLKVKL